jgi:phosphoribosylformimino-5-aminoimidazole carboxamide ribotide isomerase
MLILPAIDLRAGRCVRLTQGRKNSVTVYDADPVKVAQAFQGSGARMLHVVDLDGAFAETYGPNRQVLRELVKVLDIPIQFGGGLRSIKDVEQAIELGVNRVVVGTMAVKSLQTVSELIRSFGADHVAVAIDAQDGIVMTHGWETKEPISAMTLAGNVASVGVERVIYTDILRDGTLAGPNVDQICAIVETSLKVTASGGISSLDDLAAVSRCGIDSVIVGKALYERRFSLEEAIKLCEESQ